MRETIMLLLAVFSVLPSLAQFDPTTEIPIADTLKVKGIEWIDADNDSLLDVLIVAKTADSTYSFLFFKNIEGSSFSFARTTKTSFTKLAYFLDDYDRDNQMDILVSGVTPINSATSVLVNNGDFQFAQFSSPLLTTHAEFITTTDLDQDGEKELILSGGDIGTHVNIYKNLSSNWILVSDSIHVKATDFITADFDGDMYKDILISGKNSDNQFITTILFNEQNFYFTNPYVVEDFSDAIPITSDINYDGIPDILITGLTKSNALISKKLYGTKTKSFIEQDTIINISPKSVFAADLNSDGLLDINYFGFNQSTQIINKIVQFPNSALDLPTVGIYQQKFGDAERDGDLDLLQLTNNSIGVLKNNTSAENRAPGKILRPVAFNIFDRLFAYWDNPGDDHTPQNSLTYDLTISTQNGVSLMGDFDLFNKKRIIVTQGNNGFQNFVLLKDFLSSPFELSVQGIDNAYHAGTYGTCHGDGQPCNDLVTETIQMCGAEKPLLMVNQNALWFSFKDGFLGTFNTYSYAEASSDTIFAFIPEENRSCASIKLFLLERVMEAEKVDSVSRYVCQGQELQFEVEEGWKEISWSTSRDGTISHEPVFNYKFTQDDVVISIVSNGDGCTIKHITTLLLSQPLVKPDADVYQILKGESVQLTVTGGVEYNWQPVTGLSNPNGATTTASPTSTIEYTISITDSLGCSTVGKVLILVEETAFIPNLFTPNNDGKNDALRIYGGGQIQNFSLSIYNREGSMVFNTSDIYEAETQGWNGTLRGVEQPSGVYHWKVSGKYNNGQAFLLNGKNTGSIMLMR